MRIRRHDDGTRRGDAGSAVIELIVIGVALLVPVAYLAVAAASVQAAALASTQAVREAARAFSASITPAEGRRRAEAAAVLAFSDHGLRLPPDSLRITCPAEACLAPGSAVVVDLDWRVPLPWLPDLLGDGAAPSIPLTATHRVPVDDYRGSPS